MDFYSIIKSIVDQNVRLNVHYGVVTAITNTSGTYYLTLQLAGATETISKVRYLRSYVPRVNDTVMVLVNKSDLVVIGSLSEEHKSLNPVAYRTSIYTVSQNVETTIPFEAVENDDWDMWDIGSPSVLTIRVPGRYLLTASIVAEIISNVGVSLSIFKGEQEIARMDEDIKVASHAHHMNVTSMPVTLAINDTISMKFLHDNNPDMDLLISSGGVDHTGYFNAFGAIYLGP